MLRLPSRRRKGFIARRATLYRLQVESLEARRLLAVITVTSTGDAINATDGVVTLREAITAANDNKNISDVVGVGAYGNDTIDFDIPGTGVADDPADLRPTDDHRPADDRWLQPAGVRPQHQPCRAAAQRQIAHRDRRRERRRCAVRDDHYRGEQQHSARSGHQPHARGEDRHRLLRSTAGDNQIEGNYIGTDATGTQDCSPNPTPMSAAESSVRTRGNTIGGTTPAARNLISGNVGVWHQRQRPGSIPSIDSQVARAT